jgi:XTP/dITP diphosphohydrolase
MMVRLLAATGNRHKLEEIREILAPHGIEILGAGDVGGLPDVIEDRDTFEGNAIKKAVETAKAKGCLCLADDSGLEVEVLGGAPGVHSARYAGGHGDNAANRRKLLVALRGQADRRARFTCVIALASPAGLIGTARGEVQGRLIDEERGLGGFGYDPLFVPDGYSQTFAELSSEIKHALSHRGNSLRTALATGLIGKLST